MQHEEAAIVSAPVEEEGSLGSELFAILDMEGQRNLSSSGRRGRRPKVPSPRPRAPSPSVVIVRDDTKRTGRRNSSTGTGTVKRSHSSVKNGRCHSDASESDETSDDSLFERVKKRKEKSPTTTTTTPITATKKRDATPTGGRKPTPPPAPSSLESFLTSASAFNRARRLQVGPSGSSGNRASKTATALGTTTSATPKKKQNTGTQTASSDSSSALKGQRDQALDTVVKFIAQVHDFHLKVKDPGLEQLKGPVSTFYYQLCSAHQDLVRKLL